MQSRRLSSIAAPERRRFMSPAHILGFGLVVAFALLAVYPGQSLERRIQATVQADSLSLVYLQAWLRAMPEDHALRLLVARRLLARGDLPEVAIMLQPLLSRDEAALGQFFREAQILKLDLLVQEMWQIPVGQPGFRAAQQRVEQHLNMLASHDWDEDSLNLFIREAQSAGAPGAAQPFMHRLLEKYPQMAPQMREQLTAMELAGGNPRAVAALYFQGMGQARSTAEKREKFIAGLRVLQAGDLMAEVPEAARVHGAALENDPATLEFLTRLMTQANRMDRAEYYVTRLLRQQTAEARALQESRP